MREIQKRKKSEEGRKRKKESQTGKGEWIKREIGERGKNERRGRREERTQTRKDERNGGVKELNELKRERKRETRK